MVKRWWFYIIPNSIGVKIGPQFVGHFRPLKVGKCPIYTPFIFGPVIEFFFNPPLK